MLRETGSAGRPLEHFEVLRHSGLPRQPREYFTGLDDAEVLELLAPVNPGRPSDEAPALWWKRIVEEGMTSNGIWGGKLMWGQTEDFLARVNALPGLATADLTRALTTLLDDPLVIFVSREDKVAQAVSLWRAIQTQAWRSGETLDGEFAPSAGAEPAYNFAAIDHLVAALAYEEQCWKDWFSSTGQRPVRVDYDELDAAPQQVVGGLLDILGVPAWTPKPPLARQRDEISAAWGERYLYEREGQRVA